MIWLFAAVAFAEPCAPALAVAIVPGPGAVGVPLDIELAAGIDLGCGLAAETWTFDLLEGAAVVHTESVPYEGGNRLASAPAAALLANTAYTLRVSPDDGSGQATEAGFTTGDRAASPLDGVPAISLVEGTWLAESDQLWFSATVEAAPYPEALTMIGVAFEPGGPVRDIVTSGGPVYVSVPAAEEVDEICAVPVQWSADGTRVEGLEACGPVLIVREGAGNGCDASGLVPTAFPALLALLAIRRRRA